VPILLILASGVGLVAATAALWVQGWRRADHRFFAGLISIAVTLSLFSVVAWAATAIAPFPLIITWFLVGTLALLFALRLYRELQKPPLGERSP
jgi:cobalamin biosynthesis protein CobD/CbiB